MRRFVKEYANYRKEEFKNDYINSASNMNSYIVYRYSVEKCNNLVARYAAGMITATEAVRLISKIGYFEE